MNEQNKAPPHPDWQPIATAPAHTDVILYWPLREYDENDMPRGKIVGGLTLVSRKSGSHWDEPECMSAVGHSFDDDYEYAESPTHWMPAPCPARPHRRRNRALGGWVTPAAFKRARQALGLSQTQMASALRLKDARAVRYYEAGEREISGLIQVVIAYMLKFGPFPENGQPN